MGDGILEQRAQTWDLGATERGAAFSRAFVLHPIWPKEKEVWQGKGNLPLDTEGVWEEWGNLAQCQT